MSQGDALYQSYKNYPAVVCCTKPCPGISQGSYSSSVHNALMSWWAGGAELEAGVNKVWIGGIEIPKKKITELSRTNSDKNHV